MAITLNSNISSLMTQRQLGKATEQLASTFERLSSGMRINRASDDAAGLSVSTSLNASKRLYTASIRNINDGISALNIADGAIGELQNVLTRIGELAEQAANGVYTSTQRQALDREAQALSQEGNRIVKTTSFNGVKLINSDASNLSIQAGINGTANSGISLNIPDAYFSALADGTFSVSASYFTNDGLRQLYDVDPGDFNEDGHSDLFITSHNGSSGILYGNGDGSFKSMSVLTNIPGLGQNGNYSEVADFNKDGHLDIVTSYDVGAAGIGIRYGNGNGTFKAGVALDSGSSITSISVGDVNGDSILDIVAADATNDTVFLLTGLGGASFSTRQTLSVDATTVNRYALLGDFDGDGRLDITITDRSAATGHGSVQFLRGNGNGTFSIGTSYYAGALIDRPSLAYTADLNGDGTLDLVVNAASSSIYTLLGNGNGTFLAHTASTMSSAISSFTSYDFNSDGNLDLLTSGSNAINIQVGNGNGTFRAPVSVINNSFFRSASTLGDFNEDGITDIAAGFYTDAVNILLGNSQGVFLNVSLASQSSARTTLDTVKSTIQELATIRSTIGASLSRLEVAAKVNGTAAETYAQASSRITDADIAEETSRLVRLQILQQASTAILAQANQQPSLVLKLLL